MKKSRLKLALLSTKQSRRQWIVLEDYHYYHITVPAGFRTDLASVPRVFWSLVSPSEIAEAAVIHDFIYNKSLYSRKECDEILYDMCCSRMSKFRAYLIYLAVRIGGRKAYDKSRNN